MAKFSGKIGFAFTSESQTKPDVFEESFVERNYYGDLLKTTRKLKSSNNLNDDIVISNEVSIVSDPFANENFYSIRYVIWRGVKWKVENVNVMYPRLILSLGGVYNV